ncbi:MAG: TetR/AcrR family transcriptional regulator [Rhizobiaceae bacterium]|nr:TetR/AcrR family transcriptional regulator [Rhizobiaceae bacterium]
MLARVSLIWVNERDGLTRTSTSKTAGRPRRPETDDAILSAALSLFIEGGLAGTSFEKVAKAAGVTRATIYRRWSSREALIARALGRMKERGEEPLGRWQEMPLEALVGAMIEYGPKAWVENDARRLLARIAGSVPDAPELVETFWQVYAEPRRAAFAVIVDKAREEGVLPLDTDAELFQEMLGGAVMYRLLLIPGDNGEAEMRDYMVRLLRQLGLGRVVSKLGY